MTGPSFGEAIRVWCRVALLSFGGPAGQIAVMHRIVVEEKRWIGESRFLHALNFCMLLPGPEAQQLATYLGWLLHGWRGGIVAGTLFVIPGFVSILGLSVAYAAWQHTGFLAAVFFGLKPVVLAVVVEALLRLSRRALGGWRLRLLAAGAFVAMFVFAVPFAAVLAGAATLGAVGGRRGGAAAPDAAPAADERPIAPRSAGRTLAIALGGLAAWWLPVLALTAALGASHPMVGIGRFFGKVATVSFGGAYAVLAYVAQEAVHRFHWLRPGEMLDGLGMAETTPGPLIMVVQFVGFLAAFRSPGSLDPLTAGVAASVLVTWVTFVPCFLWIFLGAPYVERLRAIPALGAAFSAVTAAVVGVIANLLLWFALHVLFGGTSTLELGPARLTVPDLARVNLPALLIAAGGCVALLGLRWGLFPTLLAGTAAGAGWALLRG